MDFVLLTTIIKQLRHSAKLKSLAEDHQHNARCLYPLLQQMPVNDG